MRSLRWILGSVLGCLVLFATGCDVTGVTAGNTAVDVVSPAPTPQPSGNNVCNPFGNGADAPGDQGLIGNLRYLTPDMPEYTDVADYQQYGILADATLYFNQLNVPTRMFDQGFSTQNGTILTNLQGNTLYEWFSLHFESQIRLSFRDQPGNYQFAVLSDDGAILQFDQGNGMAQFINDDGTHPSHLTCATQTVAFDNNTSIPMIMDYYQGPRYNIALMLLWRFIPDGSPASALNDIACGQEGNDTFFDPSTTPPTPTDLWMGMLTRGWTVLTPDNYFLPADSGTNPCPPPTPAPSASPAPSPTPSPTPVPTPTPTPAPTASPTPAPTATPAPTPSPTPIPTQGSDFSTFGFDAAADTDTLYTVWYTPGYASTSIVFYGTSSTNLDQMSGLDPSYVESHAINVTGLQSQTTYYLESYSQTVDGLNSYSGVIVKTTK